MSHLRIHQWTCDCCADTLELTDNGSQPQGWARMSLTSPPLASPLEGERVIPEEHLCAACVERLRRFLKREAS